MTEDTYNIYRTILLTGLPRSGTTLCCHLLNRFKNVLALHEPLNPKDFDAEAGPLKACKKIANFGLQTRHSTHNQGRVSSKHINGEIPDNPIGKVKNTRGLRPSIASKGKIDISHRKLSEGFTLIIKHNAMFTALLPDLRQFFPVFGIIRNPLAVLASWNTVDININRGRIPAGEKYAPDLAKALDNCPNRLSRQMIVMEWMLKQYSHHLSKEQILRYEDVIENKTYLAQILKLQQEQTVVWKDFESRNSSYNLELIDSLYKELLQRGEFVWKFYDRESVEQLYEKMRNKKCRT